MYDIAKFYQAISVADAVKALQADPDARIIAGGSDVLIKIREGRMAGCSLVSLQGLPELTGVFLDDDGTVVIRPGTSFSRLTEHPVVRAHIPTLGLAADQVGGPQIRNIGTVGGNICNGVTSADTASTLFTLNAVLEITGPEGKRLVKIGDFYRGPGKVDLAHDEVLTAILVAKADYQGYGGHYIKYAMRNAMDIATLGVAVHVKLDGERVEDLRIAFGVAGPTPMRCPGAEAAAKGMAAGPELLDTVSEACAGEINPRTSWRASKEFRLQLARELSRRCLEQAIINAGGRCDA